MVALGATFFALHPALHGSLAALPFWLFLLSAAAIGMGSVIGGLRVTCTPAEKATKTDHQEGFAANLATALLVGLASPVSLPVSTPHGSLGAIIGIGLHKGAGAVQWHTVRDMALAWIITLPGAGFLSLLMYVAFLTVLFR
jgi:PiT family inorganic phosphate transporter